MRDSVRDSFVGFTRDLEGATSWMYLDELGYVTTGYGDMINTPAAACALRWRRPDGSLATRDEVIAEWATVRSHQEMRTWGGGRFAPLTTLRLDADGVSDLVRSTMARDDQDLARRYSAWESWPACAQMACMSLAWACGDAYHFPKMDEALERRDFEGAAQEIEMTPEHNPGNDLRRRNAANQILMRNAARVDAFQLDPDTLDWTHVLGVADAPTQPELPNPASEPTVVVTVDPSEYLGNKPDE